MPRLAAVPQQEKARTIQASPLRERNPPRTTLKKIPLEYVIVGVKKQLVSKREGILPTTIKVEIEQVKGVGP